MLWPRTFGVILLLVVAGGARLYQAVQVGELAEASRLPPAPLVELPLSVGPWIGTESTLDPLIARATGATDQILRRYQDKRTGVVLDVIILYGPPGEMAIHAPEVCYPAAGYAAVGAVAGVDREINIAGEDASVPFRTLVYTKGRAGTTETWEVYYSWRLGGRWTLAPGIYKRIERVAGMYKIQIGRTVRPGELVGLQLRPEDPNNPCEDFLRFFLPAFLARQPNLSAAPST